MDRRSNMRRCTLLMRLRWSFRLIAARGTLDYCPLLASYFITAAAIVNVHRFEEIINGRQYRIEVSNVGTGKWRAQLARLPGGSAATMPFYGTTPKEAAGQLSQWLALAHGRSRPQL
jgi:hypothetical protein